MACFAVTPGADMQTTLRITEIFYSLQGETNTSGLPTVFVRLTGCPLRCQYCDTAYAFNGGEIMSLEAILERVAAFRPRYVCVTGGEPLVRRDAQGRYKVRLDYSVELSESVSGRIFVANAELHSHGVATPDLGVCAYRNATILNTVAGRELYRLPQRSAYTSFAAPAAPRWTSAGTPAAQRPAPAAFFDTPRSL